MLLQIIQKIAMGCCQSKEDTSLSSSQTVINVPVIPGWDGVPMATMSVQAEIKLKGTWGGYKASTDPLMNGIVADNTAGAGFKLAAVFLPVHQEGKEKGKPLELDGRGAGWNSYTVRVMCIYQRDLRDPVVPLETMFLQAPITIQANLFNYSNPLEVTGYQGMYGQLGQAGEVDREKECEISV